MIGYSFGGVIAYELSMRLQAQGRPPRLLVLLDTHLMTRFPTPGHPVPMMTHLENLGRLRGKRRLRYIYRRLLNINRKLKSWRLPGQDHFIDLPHIRRLHDSNLIALQGYRPSGIYNGRVLAVNGHRPDWMLREDDDGANGWCPWLSQPPATLRLDANHVELIRPGFADAISQRIVELAGLPKGE
jgi:thioesterase domain-containing protein